MKFYNYSFTLLIAVLFASLGFMGCGEDEGNGDGDGSGLTNQLTATVNGANWESGSSYETSVDAVSGAIQVQAVSSDGSSTIYFIATPDAGASTHTMNVGSYATGGTNCLFSSGTVNITRKGVGSDVAGTFTMTTACPNGQTFTISNGKFDFD